MTEDDDTQQISIGLRRIGDLAVPPPHGTSDVLRAVDKAKRRRRAATAAGAGGLVAATMLAATFIVVQVNGGSDAQTPTAATSGDGVTGSPEILGTWVPSSIRGYRFPVDFDPMSATISFTSTGWNGSDGCNGLAGTYQYDDGSFTGQAGAQTRIGCANVPHSVVVQTAAVARVEANTLTFGDADGDSLAEYRRAVDLTTVPDVVGLPSVEAAEVLHDLGFDVFRCDTGYCVPVTVTGQTPTAGAEVPAGLNVQLFGGTAAATARCPKNPLQPTVIGVEAGLSGGGGLLCRYERQADGHVKAQGSVSLTQAQSSALRTAYEDRDLAMVDCSTSSRPIYSVVNFDPEHSSFSTVTVDLSMCGTIYAADPGATDDDDPLEWISGLATQRHVRLLDQIWTGS